MSEDPNFPDELRYSKEDEWTRRVGKRATIGVTHFAQEQLGDVVFVELPAVGTNIEAGEPFGVIESVKAVSDLFAPVSGEVVEINNDLSDQPESVNEDCYGEGWMLIVEMAEADQWEGLLTSEAYRAYLLERSED